MLQALLVNRFKLAIHHETKKLPIYALVVAKSGLNPGHPKDYYTGAAGISIARRSTRIVGTTLMFGTLGCVLAAAQTAMLMHSP